MGTILKDGDAYVLKTGNQTYLLDSQKKAKKEGLVPDVNVPVPSRDGKRIFALGGQPRSEVLRYDGRSFVPDAWFGVN
jgi:hypothetical protein